MIPAHLASMALTITVALGPALDPDPALLSEKQRSSIVRPLVQHANECIAQRVVGDKRYHRHATDLGELIVDAVPECIDRIRAMVDGYDRNFGDGSGAAFFAGPYLSVLPDAVNDLIKELDVR